MLKINKTPDPLFFKDVGENPKIRNWNDFRNTEDHFPLKIHMLTYEQSYRNTYLCAYCERKIRPETSHIEHIRPRSKFPYLMFSYMNLMISCNEPNTCGIHKDKQWEDVFISPVDDDPEPCFHYSAEGKIKEGYNERVKHTVSILNLNHGALTDTRRTIFLQMSRYPKEFIDDMDQFFYEFPSLIRYYQKNYRSEPQ